MELKVYEQEETRWAIVTELLIHMTTFPFVYAFKMLIQQISLSFTKKKNR